MERTLETGNVGNLSLRCSPEISDVTSRIDKDIVISSAEISKPISCTIEGDKVISDKAELSCKNQPVKKRTPNRSFSSLICSCWPKNSYDETTQKNKRRTKLGLRFPLREKKTDSTPNKVSESSESHNTTQKDAVEESEDFLGIKSPFSRLWSKLSHPRRSIKLEESNENILISSAPDVGPIASVEINSVAPSSSEKHNAKANENRKITLLGDPRPSDKDKKCFIIDLDETLVHSSFKAVDKADFRVGVEIDNIVHQVYVLKRPYVDEFLKAMADIYECVLFTASLAKYADPVADFIDKWNVFRFRLFRESCVYHRGSYVKDLAQLGRPIDQVVILDNSPASYMFHATHAVQITSWFDDKTDRALLELIPYFKRLATEPNVVEFLRNHPPPQTYASTGSFDCSPVNSLAASAPSRSSQSRVSPIARLIKNYTHSTNQDSSNSAPVPTRDFPSILSPSDAIASAENPISSSTRTPLNGTESNPTIPTSNSLPGPSSTLGPKRSNQVLTPAPETEETSLLTLSLKNT